MRTDSQVSGKWYFQILYLYCIFYLYFFSLYGDRKYKNISILVFSIFIRGVP